jgi:hypothetical protein
MTPRPLTPRPACASLTYSSITVKRDFDPHLRGLRRALDDAHRPLSRPLGFKAGEREAADIPLILDMTRLTVLSRINYAEVLAVPRPDTDADVRCSRCLNVNIKSVSWGR